MVSEEKILKKKLEVLKKERMAEVLDLKKRDEKVCQKMEVDPFFVSTSVVPSTRQLQDLKDHIRSMEDEE